ncbi:hypothetical protein LJK88_27075 [Paenibacillus sp. P26]|nr:hypothetical protein LJK88_27075 [Paenibacillus sp. P26]UUZ94967.1 hypothetical protein LJK87_10920 [Paenibacillus sp. P25]
MTTKGLRIYEDHYKIYELSDPDTGSSIRIAPERGGMLIGWAARGRELLYLDQETFHNPKANVRGGVPVLFPISGQLTDSEYEWKGTVYRMPNHGIARNRPWQVDHADDQSVRLRLTADEETRAAFPFEFELIFTYTLRGGAVTIEQTYRNLSGSEMPVYAGFHPYFAASSKSLAYETDASRYFDYNDERDKSYDGGPLDLEPLVESVVFLGAEKREIAFTPAEQRIRMTYGDEFKYVVLWSVAGKPFVCVEPWMARTNELNRKEELVLVPPHGELNTVLTMAAED